MSKHACLETVSMTSVFQIPCTKVTATSGAEEDAASLVHATAATRWKLRDLLGCRCLSLVIPVSLKQGHHL